MNKNKKKQIAKKVVKKVENSSTSAMVKLFLIFSLLINGILIYVLYENKDNLEIPFINQTTTKVEIKEKIWNAANTTCKRLKVNYLKLNQMGDSIYIQCDNFDILVDAGEKGDGTEVVLPHLKENVADGVLDLAIITHMDSDHYAGMVGLSGKGIFDSSLKISNVVDYGHRNDYEKSDYENLRDQALASSKGNYYPIQRAFDDQDEETFNKIKIGDNFTLEFLNTNYYDISGADKNEKSIAFVIYYYEYKFFFGGDIFIKQEKQIISNYPELTNVDFYKASHHGSITSNGENILNHFNPRYIFLNCIEDNKHGIPQKERLNSLKNYANGNIYVTGLNGTITVECSENSYDVKFKLNNKKFSETAWFERILND